jgi:hypothetical protein
MVKPSLLITAVAVSIALPAAQGMTSPKAPSAGVAKTLLQQINSGPDGHITRNVACGRGSKAGLAFTCDLKSVRSTSIRANIAVVGGTLRTTWEPIKG